MSGQSACKPGSVWLAGPQARKRGGHSSGAIVTDRLMQPTRTARRKALRNAHKRSADRPYSVLLPVGFAVPSALPRPRCALTAPFHPDHRMRWRSAFCGTFPRVTPAGRYPAPSFHGARTFLSRIKRKRPPDRLTAWMWAREGARVKYQWRGSGNLGTLRAFTGFILLGIGVLIIQPRGGYPLSNGQGWNHEEDFGIGCSRSIGVVRRRLPDPW